MVPWGQIHLEREGDKNKIDVSYPYFPISMSSVTTSYVWCLLLILPCFFPSLCPWELNFLFLDWILSYSSDLVIRIDCFEISFFLGGMDWWSYHRYNSSKKFRFISLESIPFPPLLSFMCNHPLVSLYRDFIYFYNLGLNSIPKDLFSLCTCDLARSSPNQYFLTRLDLVFQIYWMFESIYVLLGSGSS